MLAAPPRPAADHEALPGRRGRASPSSRSTCPAHAPDWVRHGRACRPAPPARASDYAVVCDLPTLIWAANLGTIEFHVPLWHAGQTAHPARAAGPHGVRPRSRRRGRRSSSAAGWRLLDQAEIARGPRGSGGPEDQRVEGPAAVLPPRRTADVGQGARRRPGASPSSSSASTPSSSCPTCASSSAAARCSIDWSQNHPAKTTVAVYSLRARRRADGLHAGHLGRGGGVCRRRRPGDAGLHPTTCSSGSKSEGDLFAPLVRK